MLLRQWRAGRVAAYCPTWCELAMVDEMDHADLVRQAKLAKLAGGNNYYIARR